jgi:hypothetical protein
LLHPPQGVVLAGFPSATVYQPLGYPRHTDLVPLAGVDPVAVSEVLADLANLAGKAR